MLLQLFNASEVEFVLFSAANSYAKFVYTIMIPCESIKQNYQQNSISVSLAIRSTCFRKLRLKKATSVNQQITNIQENTIDDFPVHRKFSIMIFRPYYTTVIIKQLLNSSSQ